MHAASRHDRPTRARGTAGKVLDEREVTSSGLARPSEQDQQEHEGPTADTSSSSASEVPYSEEPSTESASDHLSGSRATPQPVGLKHSESLESTSRSLSKTGAASLLHGRHPSRSTSMASNERQGEESSTSLAKRPRKGREHSSSTQRSKRRATLAEKLQEVFGLAEVEEVLAEYPAWLFRSVLLQGFLYLTTGHLCFYAYLNSKEGQNVRSGTMTKRNSRTRLYQKFWFVLKDDVLSWYPSSTDPYFPVGQIDMHYVIAVEPSSKHPQCFKVSTGSKTYRFNCESVQNQHEWIKTLRKTVFKAQNQGESVKVGITHDH